MSKLLERILCSYAKRAAMFLKKPASFEHPYLGTGVDLVVQNAMMSINLVGRILEQYL